MQALGDDDKANIHQTIDDEVLERRGDRVPLDRGWSRRGDRLSVEGELTLAGRDAARSRSTLDGRRRRRARARAPSSSRATGA